MIDPTERFSDRVENYVKHRPSYPMEVVDKLRTHCALSASSRVADLGSGTGIFTELLLQSGCHVFAVEPNEAIRHAADQHLGKHPHFHSVPGAAEQTGLDSESVDIVTAAQAFHWFRTGETLQEVRRILKPAGWIVLVWNQRSTQSSFQSDYDALLRRHVSDYDKVNHRNGAAADIASFIDPAHYQFFTFENHQYLDLSGIKGRMQSSSYTPPQNEPGFAELMVGLEALFRRHATEGRVAFEYETQLHLGRIVDGEQRI